MKILHPTLLILLCSVSFFVQGQNLLQNGSFESKEYGPSRTPENWINCGFPGESPPDIFAKGPNEFKVDHEPQDGLLFVHMVSRDNETYESLGQQLRQPLMAGKRYLLTAFVSRSPITLSKSRTTNKPVLYNAPIRVQFSGGEEICNQEEIIHKTAPITESKWEKVEVVFVPEDTMNYFVISAINAEMKLQNGNILIDNISITMLAD